MTRAKKIFVVIAIIFLILLAYASYDISSRTTFPGSRPQLQERIRDTYASPDSTETNIKDTVHGQ